MCLKSATNYVTGVTEYKDSFQLKVQQEKSLLHFLIFSLHPTNLIKSKPYTTYCNSATTVTILLRNRWGLGEIGYFYKSIGLSRKVRYIRYTVTPYKKVPEKAKMECEGTQYITIIILEIESA